MVLFFYPIYVNNRNKSFYYIFKRTDKFVIVPQFTDLMHTVCLIFTINLFTTNFLQPETITVTTSFLSMHFFINIKENKK
jgi:hypothetical protein